MTSIVLPSSSSSHTCNLVVVLPRLIIKKLSFDLNVRGNPMLVSFEIHHGGCFTPTPSRSYVGRHVSSVDVVDIDEFLETDDPFDGLNEILGDFANTGKEIIVHVELEVDMDNEIEEESVESDTEENDTSGSDLEDLDYDPKHDELFDDNEHILEDVIVHEHDPDVIDYDSFGSDLDDGIDFDRRTHLRAVQDHMHNQFDAGISKMKAFSANRIASDKMTGSPFPGQILTAVRVDANNVIYLISYVIVEAESKAFWCWFLNLLGEDLGTEVKFSYTFIFDRQKFCVKHIHEIMKSQFKRGVYKDMLWNAARAIIFVDFNKNMSQLKAKCNLLLNNICEVVNRQLLDGRDQPIITCLEYIREYLMKMIIVVQKVIAKTVRPLTLTVIGIFDAIKKAANDYIIDWIGGYLYQVTGLTGINVLLTWIKGCVLVGSGS
ncbi:hypothetical protein Tco_0506458 [Tanacetum coccineum]